MKYLVTSVAFLGLLLTSPVFADTFVRTSSQFELPQGQVIEGNFLGAGNPVSLSGDVTADATLVGNRVTVAGTVGGDLLAVGVLSRIDGTIREDVRVLSGNTTISGTVAGDVLIVGGSVDILSGTVIEGDLLLYAGTAVVSGEVVGDVLGSQRSLTIDGPVGGGIDVHVGQLTLGSNASVTEAVRYTSNNLLNQTIDTVVAGSILRNDPVYASGNTSLRSIALPFIILLFSTLLWLFLSKRTLQAIVTQTVFHIPRSAVTGLVSVVVTPLIIFVLLLSMLGGFVALIGLAAYVLLLLLAVAALPAIVGYACVKASNLQTESLSVMTVVIGSVVCIVLLLLPAIGLFLLFFLIIISLGGLVEAVIRASR